MAGITGQSGSMVDQGELNRRVAQHRADRDKKDLTPDEAQAMLDKANSSKAPTEHEKKIDSLLPKEVTLMRPDGTPMRVPYADFREQYKTIYTQASEGRLIMPGYVTYEFDMLGVVFTLRSLRRSEQDALSAYLGANPTAEQHTEFQLMRLVAAMVRIAGQDVPQVGTQLRTTSLQEWLDNATVKKTKQALENMSQEVVDLLFLKLVEVSEAVRFAVHETLKNR